MRQVRNPLGHFAATIALMALSSRAALGQTVSGSETSDVSRATARSLGIEGLAAYDAGDLPKALDRISRAYRLHPVPTLALWNGKVLAKMGKLVAASERLREAVNLKATGGDAEAQAAAQATARQELEALQARIGSLQIDVQGAVDPTSRLLIDGVEVSLAVIGNPMPTDPGEHTIVLNSAKLALQQRVRVAQGAHASVVLGSQSQSPTSHYRSSGVAAASVTAPANDSSSTGERSWQKPVGWVSLGIGALGIGTWAVTGAMVMNRDNDLQQHCPSNNCPSDYRDKLDGFRELRTISTIGFVTGLVGLGAGSVLLLTSPRSSGSEAHAHWRAWVGVNAVGIAKEY
jgi:hypothetical protein